MSAIASAGVVLGAFDLGMGDLVTVDVIVFAIGWALGWFLLWRPRALPCTAAAATPGPTRPAVAVIIPARDEAEQLPTLLPPLLAQLRPDDELIVVDDRSADGTTEVALQHGAEVVPADPPEEGWLGKPSACWRGAIETTAPVLAFIDADVTPADDLLDRLVDTVGRHPDDVVSVQPWHHTVGAAEQFSLMCNITALMSTGAFTPLGERVRTDVAFGPVLALTRSAYERVGGHAAPEIRGRHTEDIALASAVGRSHLHTGAPDTTFRMYPGGLAPLVRGWTRSIATGARHTRWWWVLGVMLWVWSLAGGWIATPFVYPLSALQFWVLGRRAGSLNPLVAAVYPVAVAVFVIIFVRSLLNVVLGRDVSWKGRRVAARPG